MASFAVSGTTLGVARASPARSAADRRGAPDSPALLFIRKKDSSRAVLSCAGATGKVLVPGDGRAA